MVSLRALFAAMTPAFLGINAISQLELQPRDSPTQRCGAAYQGLKCTAMGTVNLCCSQYGWCGDSPGHCGGGCQAAYGKCGSGSVPSTRPLLGMVPYGFNIYTCTTPGTIAMTYDDGPYLWTSQLLDILDYHGIKATFFVTANNHGKGPLNDPARPWVALLKRMYASGHQIAGHTMDHPDLNTLSESDRRAQMTELEVRLKEIIGCYPTYMRPPFSSCGAACMSTMKDLGYHVVLFDLDTDDYNNPTPALIQRSKDIVTATIKGADPRYRGFISIAHDPVYQTVYNLTGHQIAVGSSAGFRFVTLGECLGDPSSNWYRTEL